MDGNDNVHSELEKQVERLVNKALDYVLDLNEYDLQSKVSEKTHVNIDTDKYVTHGLERSYSVNINFDAFHQEM